MRAVRAIVLGLAALVCLGANANAEPRVDPERVVFETVWGDLVFALYPDVAPAHVKQIKTLVRLGAYDGTRFHRVVPGFVIQANDVSDRLESLDRRQRLANKPLPLEVRPELGLKHVLGTLSMARMADPDSATSSFSIVLGPAPTLDGQFTIFGQLENGGKTVNRLLAVPRSRREVPSQRLTIRRAYLEADLAGYYADRQRSPASEIDNSVAGKRVSARAKRLESVDVGLFYIGTLVAVVVVALLGFALFDRLTKSLLLSLLMLQVLIAGFALFIALTPMGQKSWLAAVTFAGLVGLFKFMNRFESKA